MRLPGRVYLVLADGDVVYRGTNKQEAWDECSIYRTGVDEGMTKRVFLVMYTNPKVVRKYESPRAKARRM